MRTPVAPPFAVLLCLLALCLSTALSAGAVAAAEPADRPAPRIDNTRQELSSLDIGDAQTITIDLEPDGDAVLTVDIIFEGVDTESKRAAFRQTAAEWERTESLWPFFNNTVVSASAHAGREMSLEGPRRSSRLDRDQNIGILTVEMTWRRFAEVSNGTLVADDAFYVDDRTPWIERLWADQQLVVVGPEGYELTGAPDGPKFENNRIVWTGEQQFGQGDLRTTWERSSNGLLSDPAVLAAGVVFLVVLVLYGAWRFSSRSGRPAGTPPVSDPSPSEPVTDTDGGSPARSEVDAPPESPTDAPASPDASASTPEGPTGDHADGSAAADSTSADSSADAAPAAEPETESGSAAGSGKSTEADDEIDRELLSDEELVERMLDGNGGRMKQANIVKETGWSNAKVSQLLSEMDEDDRIDKLRIGRENLISLPDEDVTTID